MKNSELSPLNCFIHLHLPIDINASGGQGTREINFFTESSGPARSHTDSTGKRKEDFAMFPKGHPFSTVNWGWRWYEAGTLYFLTNFATPNNVFLSYCMTSGLLEFKLEFLGLEYWFINSGNNTDITSHLRGRSNKRKQKNVTPLVSNLT